MATAAAIPFAALAVSHHVALGTPAALGALFVSLGDVGSSIRARALAMGIATIGGALLFALGRSLGHPWWLAVPALFLVTLIAGMLGVYGRGGAALGLFLNLVFVIGLGFGGGPSAAITSAEGFAIGGLFAILMALAPWGLRQLWQGPLRPLTTPAPATTPARTQRPSLAPLLAQLTFSSPVSRFAVLRAVAVTLAAGIGWGLEVSHPQWAAIVVLLCVKPDRTASLLATAQLATGTILGALVADLILVAIHSQLLLAGVAIVLMVIAVAVQELHSGLAACCTTLTILLLISIPIGGLSLAALRIFEVVVGAVIALTATLLWSRVGGTISIPNAKAAQA